MCLGVLTHLLLSFVHFCTNTHCHNETFPFCERYTIFHKSMTWRQVIAHQPKLQGGFIQFHDVTWELGIILVSNCTLYSLIWSSFPTSGISQLKTEQEPGLTLLELSGEVQSCIYHLCRCHPQVINCISCQWRTLKDTVEIKKNKAAS